ncbi:hypothetical protein HWD31_gp69 [Pantoea phage vB_PagM_SSEM1]|uniref:Uncharacterized protein n=1 Tax=Pantoea phage vB_PagM_SSEM1 TaxID=2721760 RepID=A0A6H0D9U8_9CAUD|nr:hypothetical protein HWD31_gp69 [Pantoea phage vB_PagM_SSEM1]QIS79369.1 hypothetical protein SSEM1_gp69 [Pantoea phage vB_PagM_SSEM1]
MSVITRIDARSKNNAGFEIRDAATGKTLVFVETLGAETELRISSSDDVEIVKSNGVKLKRKK